jgi:predicted DNA-binding transcriptional regulator YafY
MADGSSPASRALRTLDLLRLRPGATATELAERLGVTERAARRYIDVLREAGVPVESTRGPYGGYRLGRGATLAPVQFDEEEALDLVMAVLEGRPSAGDDVDPVGRALGKVVRALPARVARQAALLRDSAAAVPADGSARPDPSITRDLVRATAERRTVRIGYRPASGQERAFTVDPWAVVVRHGRWYLLCRAHHAAAVRAYRVDRVTAVEPAAGTFAPPDDLDAVRLLETHLGSGWRFATRVRFAAPASDVAPWIGPVMGVLASDGDGCVLTGSTQNPAMYAQEWLAAVPFPFTVEEGPELREAVAAVAARFAAAVADPAP